MPLPFEFQGKGVLDFSSDFLFQQQKWNKEGCCYVGSEQTSVLDPRRSPSPPTSSTLSSSLGSGGGGGGSGGDASAAATVAGSEKCGPLGMEDWENVLSEFAASPTHDQSMLRFIMGDIDDPTAGLTRLLQGGAPPPDIDFHGGFGVVYQGSELGPGGGNSMGTVGTPVNEPIAGFQQPSSNSNNIQASHGRMGSVSNPTPLFASLANNLLPISASQGLFHQQQFQHQHQHQHQHPVESLEEKPQIFNPQLLVQSVAPHNQAGMLLPLSYSQHEQSPILPPPPKRLNSSGVLDPNSQIPKVPFDSGQELYVRRQLHQQSPQGFPHHLQLLPNHLQHRQTMTKPKMVGGDEMVHHQQAIIDQIFKFVELVEMGNSVLAQAILARLNHQLSPIGKPFQRVSFYFKESLQQLLLHMNTGTTTTTTTATDLSSNSSPFNLIFKIGAYKSFSEISPLVQFANFTCNQALLEALEGFDRIHILDFDIEYGGQWASLMQELALRNGGPPSLKITAFASPSTHDELEFRLTQENLNHFASEINMAFELEIVSLDSLNSASLSMFSHVSNSEAIAVNLPIGCFSNYPLSLPFVLRFVKQLSPKIVVSLDRGCDRNDLSFAQHIIHALHSYSSLLESLDAVNVNPDALQKIEKFLLQPGIEKIVLGRHRSPGKTPSWRSLFVQSGFVPLPFSNFTESQADCLVHRTPVRGFHIEKRQSSLILCWQQKDLISASAWRC